MLLLVAAGCRSPEEVSWGAQARFGGHGFTLGEGLQVGTASIEGGAVPWGAWQASPCAAPCEDEVRREGDGVSEWVRRTARGIEQGWIVRAPPDDGRLELEVATPGAEATQVGPALLLASAGRTWSVADARSWDADHVPLPTRMVAGDEGFRVEVDTAGARFPVTVDPVYTEATDDLPPDERPGDATADELAASVATGDFDGDGLLDLAATRFDPTDVDGDAIQSYLEIYLGRADGLQTVPDNVISLYAAPPEHLDIDCVGPCDTSAQDRLVVGGRYEIDVGGFGAILEYSYVTVFDTPSSDSSADTAAYGLLTIGDCGSYVANLGDLNGDGAYDLGFSCEDYVQVYVVRGGSAYTLSETVSTASFGCLPGALEGGALLDADSTPDVVLGCTNVDRAYWFAGTGTGFDATSSGRHALSPLDTSSDYDFGESMAVLSAFDGTNSWLAIGAPDEDSTTASGSVYLYEVARASGTSTFKSIVDLGGSYAGARFGTQLAAGDVDNNGIPDLVIGAPNGPGGTSTNPPGEVYYVEFNQALVSDSSWTLAAGTSNDEYTVQQLSPVTDGADGAMGSDLALALGVSTLNGDDIGDIVVGDQFWDLGTDNNDYGAFTVFYGYEDHDRDGVPGTRDCDDEDAAEDDALTCYADTDGDGYAVEADTIAVAVNASGQCVCPTAYTEPTASSYLGFELASCDDTSLESPAGVETCDAADLDEDCDGNADDADEEGAANPTTTVYPDCDGDGQGDWNQSTSVCDGSTRNQAHYKRLFTCDDGTGNPDDLVTNGDDCYDQSDAVLTDYDGDSVAVNEECDGFLNVCPDDPSTWTTDAPDDEDDIDGDRYVECGFSSGISWRNRTRANWTTTTSAVSQPLEGEDCDDTDPSITTSITWYRDDDVDGVGLSTSSDSGDCLAPSSGSWSQTAGDCDDSDANITNAITYYLDKDRDGYGISSQYADNISADGLTATYSSGTYAVEDTDDCTADTDYTDNQLDCDDTTAGVTYFETFYLDGDGDGYGDFSLADRDNCEPNSGYVDFDATGDFDCDDDNAAVNPGAEEVCDDADLDENCNGTSDDDDPTIVADLDASGGALWFLDDDGDGQGAASTLGAFGCDDPSTASLLYVGNGDDCDDSDETVMSGTTVQELCDGQLNRCDDASTAEYQVLSDGTTTTVPVDEYDGDGDRYVACGFRRSGEEDTVWQAVGWSTNPDVGSAPEEGEDCDDDDADVFPGAPELCDGQLNDCDQDTTTGYLPEEDAPDDEVDDDGDGYVGCGDPTVDGVDGLPDWSSTTVVSGGGDCDPDDASTHPYAASLEAEPWRCMRDADTLTGDAWAGAGCGASVAAEANGGDGFGDAAPATGIDAGSDCDDTRLDIHPGMLECCEIATQEDNDCNGDPNSTGDLESSALDTGTDGSVDDIANGSVELYRDYDLDGFGCKATTDPNAPNATKPGCGVAIQTCAAGEGWSTNASDCDDTNDAIHPGADEVCNNASDDCDNEIDEYADLGDPEVSGCLDMFRDGDEDSYGDPELSLCLCQEADGSNPEINNDPYVLDSTDCDDLNASTNPGRTDEDLDGSDNDCNGLLAVVELDCDDDGAFPALPVGAVATFATADDLGLSSCGLGPGGVDDPDAIATITCFGQPNVELVCDASYGRDADLQPVLEAGYSGLWQLRYSLSDDGFGGRFDGGRREYAESRPCVGVEDCDDQCASRCPLLTEDCDGIDNNCTTVGAVGESGGIPDAMRDDTSVPGTVAASEVDLDLDGYLACDDFRSTDDEHQVSTASCGSEVDDPALLTDCNDRCALAFPDNAEVCDGTLNLCGGSAEGTDRDRDGAFTCGAWGDAGSEVTEEQVLLLVWVRNDPATSLQADATDTGTDTAADASLVASPDRVVPLLLPRLEAPEADADLEARLEALVGDLDTSIEAEGTRDATPLLDACDRTDGYCAVARVTLSDQSDKVLWSLLQEGTGEADADEILRIQRAQSACVDHWEQCVARTVWGRARILEARTLVVEWGCRVAYGVGCADVTESSPLVVGWDTIPEVDADDLDAAAWYKELGNHQPEPWDGGTVAWCWDDPSDPNPTFIQPTGGDCADGDPDVSRDIAEGPMDLVALYRSEPGDCSLCLDGKDNNCDGQTDAADPSCAVCFVGQGQACTRDGDCTSGSASGALALLGVLAWRRRTRAA